MLEGSQPGSNPMTCGPVGTQAGHRLDAAQARRLVPAQLCSAQEKKGNAIRSTWYFLEISESNPALTRRERSASHREAMLKGLADPGGSSNGPPASPAPQNDPSRLLHARRQLWKAEERLDGD